MQNEYQSIGAGAVRKRRLPVIQGMTGGLRFNVEETEHGLYCIGGGTLCEIFKKASGKRMYRNSINRCCPARKNTIYISIISAIKMTSVEKQNIPASLQQRDKRGMILPKQGFLPFINMVNTLIMEYAITDGLKTHSQQFCYQ